MLGKRPNDDSRFSAHIHTTAQECKDEPNIGEKVIDNLIYKNWDKFDKGKKGKALSKQVQTFLLLEYTTNYSNNVVK